MTFLEMQTEVLRKLGEPVPPSVLQKFFSVQDAKDALNEGYETISEASEWYETTGTLSYGNQIYYDLSDNSVLSGVATKPLLTLKFAYSNQNNRWMRQTNWRELDEQVYPAWERSIGEPDYWLMRGAWWLGTHPHKTSASGTATLHYTALPVRMSADGDTPGFPEEFQQGLIEYALYDLYCQEHEFKKGLRHWIEYLKYETALTEYVQSRMTAPRTAQFGGYLG